MFKKVLFAAIVAGFASIGSAQTPVADLAALRALGTGTDLVITGTVIVASPKDGVQPSRNQFLIVDASGADGKTGIVVDDNSANFGTSIAVGDTITNFRGDLVEFGGLLEFVPSASGTPTVVAGAAIGDPLLTPTLITGSEAWEDVEGEVIRVNGVDVAETGVWTANTTYTITPSAIGPVNRIRFQGSSTSELIGDAIPAGTFDVIGEAREYSSGGDFQVLPRFDSDLITASVSDWSMF